MAACSLATGKAALLQINSKILLIMLFWICGLCKFLLSIFRRRICKCIFYGRCVRDLTQGPVSIDIMSKLSI